MAKMIDKLLQNKELRALMSEELLVLLEGTKSQRKKLEIKYRKKRLQEFIELANLLPATHPAGDLDELLGRDKEGPHTSEHEFLLWIEKFKLLLVYLERFPAHFREYVLEDSKESLAQINMADPTDDASLKHVTKIYGALCRYDDFRKVREKLRKLVRIAQTAPEQKGFGFYFLNRVDVHASLRVDKDGTVKISFDPFAEAIEGVDATRIRECNDCRRIFWATRKDQSCCSKDCANRYHVRRHREKYASDPIGHKLRRLDREVKHVSKKGK